MLFCNAKTRLVLGAKVLGTGVANFAFAFGWVGVYFAFGLWMVKWVLYMGFSNIKVSDVAILRGLAWLFNSKVPVK